jgi:IS4 transposase
MAKNNIKKKYTRFQDILSETDLHAVFEKFHVKDERERKLPVVKFVWLMVFSALEPRNRGSLLVLIGFYLGSIASLFAPDHGITSLSKNALSKRLGQTSWYLFRGIYLHLLRKYRDLMKADDLKFLDRFKDAFAIDGSVIALCKRVEHIFKSVHQGKASLKLNAKFSLKLHVLTKLQVSMGKRHDSRFKFVTNEAEMLYLCDLGYWAYTLFQTIIDAGSYFVFRLKGSCDPLITQVPSQELSHLVGQRLSAIKDHLGEQTTLDVTVQLSQAKNPKFRTQIRLIGLLYDAHWHFYVTNIFDRSLTPDICYQLYAVRWQVELYFDIVKNFLHLQHIISRTKNGIMIEIYSALILHLLTQIIIAQAAQQTGKSIDDFSFQRSFKLVKGVLLANISQVFRLGLKAFEQFFPTLINVVATMGLSQTKLHISQLKNNFSP